MNSESKQRFGSAPARAIFLDRDGVVNRRLIGDYVKRWEEFDFLPDIFDVLPAIHRNGYRAVLITNQRGIGRGLMSEDDLKKIHNRMQQELLERTGHRFDALYFCPHNHDARCTCRKPLPGMLLQAAAELGLDLAASWMIGDSESDIQAGNAAGCRTIRIAPPGTETAADLREVTLLGAWEHLLNISGPSMA